MIPIGAKVKLNLYLEREQRACEGYVTEHSNGFYPYRVSIIGGIDGFPVMHSEIRLECKRPACFTLWQLNALTNMPANTGWIPTCDGDITCIENVLDPGNVAQDPLFS